LHLVLLLLLLLFALLPKTRSQQFLATAQKFTMHFLMSVLYFSCIHHGKLKYSLKVEVFV
jgi:uncharacterized membrane protein YphA (DoxX/SURF4 family)